MPGARRGLAILAVPVLLALLTLVFMAPFLRPSTGREVLDGHDLVDQQYPLLSFLFDSVRDGHGLPLWNPYQFSGQTTVGNPQSTLFYPPAWLLVPLGVPRGVGWLVTLHLWLGAWGLAVFARRLGATWAGALIGGCVYAFSAVLGAHLDAGHLNYILCQAWLPWLAAAYLWSVAQPRWWLAALPGAAALGMCILAGYPPLLYFAALWLAGLWLFAGLQAGAPRVRALWQALRPLLVMALAGILLGAALLLPAGEFTLRSARAGGESLAFSGSYPLPGSQLLTVLFPNLYGEPRLPEHGYWGLPFYEENTIYVGILPLVAFFLARRRPATILLIAMAALGLVVSLGLHGGLFNILYWLLPGYSLFRVPARALYFVVVGAAGVMALWVSDLQTLAPAERVRLLRPAIRWGLPVLAVLAAAASFVFTAYYGVHSGDAAPPWRGLYSGEMIGIAVVAIGAAWLVLRLWASADAEGRPAFSPRWALAVTLCVALVDVWHISLPMVNVSAVDVPALWQAVARAEPAAPDFRVMVAADSIEWQNGATYTHHLSVSGYDQLVDRRYQQLLDAAHLDPLSPVARLLGVRYAVSDTPLPDDPDLRLLSQEQGWFLYAVSNALPRAFIVPNAQTVASDAAALEALASWQQPVATALVDRPVNCPAATLAGAPAATARIAEYAPNTVGITTGSPQGGVLVLTDSYDPYWTVSVDGVPAELLRVDVALRGVCVPPGSHYVQFVYRPTLFWTGAAVSGAAWSALGLVALVVGLRRPAARAGGTAAQADERHDRA